MATAYLTNDEYKSYYTPQFIEDLFDDTSGGDEPDITVEDRITANIEQASGIMNSYMSSNYDVPLTVVPVPEEVKYYCKVITTYISADRRWENVDEPAKFQTDYNNAMDWLKGIKDGIVKIPGVPENIIGTDSGASGTSQTPVFQRSEVQGLGLR